MRRADRLFQILQLMRNRRVVTAKEIATRLEISERTVYRDMQDLSLSGVPLESEAGVGYRLKPGFDLPPLMFSEEELVALRLGAAIVKAWADESLSKAAQSAQDRINAVLPERLKLVNRSNYLLVPDFFIDSTKKQQFSLLRRAITTKCKIRMTYCKLDGTSSERDLEPLGLFYWGNKWTLGAWCDLRSDFRTFRVDRIAALLLLKEDAVHTLEEYMATISAEEMGS